MAMDNNLIGASNVAWFHHAVERENYWSAQSDANNPLGISYGMVARWKREKMIAYGRMTQAERNSLPRGNT